MTARPRDAREFLDYLALAETEARPQPPSEPATTEPTIAFTVAAGAITGAYPATAGAGCTSTPTVVYPTRSGGVEGSVTISGNIGTSITDSNLLGQLLYDNAAAAAPLSGVLSGTSTAATQPCPQNGACEPGLPVMPFGVITAVGVN